MISYYHTRIGSEPDEREREVLQAERLYHEFYVDLETGYESFDRLFREADNKRYISFCELLLGAAKMFRDEISKLHPDWDIFINVYDAWLNLKLNKLDVAGRVLKKSWKELENNGWHDRLDEVLNSLGYLARMQGDYRKALEYFEKAGEYNKKAREERTRPARPDEKERDKISAMILNNIGNIYRLQGSVDEAHQYCKTGLGVREKLGDEAGIAHSCYILGLISREYGDIMGALRYFDRAEELFTAASRKVGIANVYRWKGYIYYRANNYRRAFEQLERSLRIIEEESAPLSDLADTLDIIGRMYRDYAALVESEREECSRRGEVYEVVGLSEDQNRLHDAGKEEYLRIGEEYIRKGFEKAEASSDLYKLAEAYLSYVILYYSRGEYDACLASYEEGIAKSQAVDREYHLLLSYYERFAGNAYYNLGEYDKAFEHFAQRCFHAAHCRAMELGMTMDDIGDKLIGLRSQGNELRKQCDYLINTWNRMKIKVRGEERILGEAYPHLIAMCRNIKEFVA